MLILNHAKYCICMELTPMVSATTVYTLKFITCYTMHCMGNWKQWKQKPEKENEIRKQKWYKT